MKIMAVCGSGLGSSLMIEMNIKKILKELGKSAVVSHCDVASATPGDADYFVVAKDLAASLKRIPKVIVLNSLLDKVELKEKIEMAWEEFHGLS